jgi:GGDEF domain-containing protein
MSSKPESEQTLIRVIRILVQGIGQHAIEGDPDESTLFPESINGLSDSLVDGIEPEDYTRRTAKRQSLQTAELKNMVQMLTATVGGISAVSNANVSILGEIEKQVASASELNDIRTMKGKLSGCLAEIKKEAERQASETSDTVERLSIELAQVRHRSASLRQGEEKDATTGLALRPEAEVALAGWPPGSRAFVALLVFDRLPVLNQRFGRDVGDEILVAFAKMLQQRLKPPDQLFRWGGPAFLALLPREASIDIVRTEIGRLMNAKVEHTIQTRSLSILIPLTGRWCLFPLMSAPRLMYQKLDAFAADPAFAALA